jgi:hypothetical protein
LFRSDSKPLLLNQKRGVDMTEIISGVSGTRARPAAKILLKEGPGDSCEGVRALDDERFLLAWGGRFIGSHRAIEIRALPDARLVDSLPWGAEPFVLQPPYLLANGPLYGGYWAALELIHLDEKRLVVELPVSYPFVRTSAGAIFGRIRKDYDFGSASVDPALAARFPDLERIVAGKGGVLVKTDADGRVDYTVDEKQLCEPYAELTGLALSPDESILHYSGHMSAGAIDLATRKTIWMKHFGHPQGEHHVWVRRMALSPDGKRMAVGGSSGWKEPNLRILGAEDGDVLAELPWNGLIESLRFHGDVLLVAGQRGQLTLIDEAYQRRDVKVASSNINDLAVIGGGVLCACSQKQLRLVSLLDDE